MSLLFNKSLGSVGEALIHQTNRISHRAGSGGDVNQLQLAEIPDNI
jgi:hypothetical protein